MNINEMKAESRFDFGVCIPGQYNNGVFLPFLHQIGEKFNTNFGEMIYTESDIFDGFSKQIIPRAKSGCNMYMKLYNGNVYGDAYIVGSIIGVNKYGVFVSPYITTEVELDALLQKEQIYASLVWFGGESKTKCIKIDMVLRTCLCRKSKSINGPIDFITIAEFRGRRK